MSSNWVRSEENLGYDAEITFYHELFADHSFVSTIYGITALSGRALWHTFYVWSLENRNSSCHSEHLTKWIEKPNKGYV